jgi:hypothetical protein
MRNGHVFLKSGLKVKSQNQKKITIKLNCLFLKKNPLLNENKMDIFLRLIAHKILVIYGQQEVGN